MANELNLEYIEELSKLYPTWDCDPYEEWDEDPDEGWDEDPDPEEGN